MIKIPRRLSKIYNSDALLHENYLLTITENFIKEESDRGSFSYKIDDFQKVLFGKKSYFHVYFTTKSYCNTTALFFFKRRRDRNREFYKNKLFEN